MFDAIRARPGLSMSELGRALGLYWPSVALHVGRLESEGLVQSLRAGRRRVLVPRLASATETPFPDVLSEPACRVVALAIAARPGSRVWEVCEATEMSGRAVYHHVKRLVDAGLVASSRPSRHRGLSATPALLAWLARGGP
ncbi:MAG TPA: winged helix-turn-helix transcriptional regulator [Candidatus Thermoplasmatota archaeon]|nr:winged helix-turn-helix transcriptional regulator [Candidatus Thermoplasmatota archaeon]